MLGSYLARLALTLPRSLSRAEASPLEPLRLPMRVWPTDVDLYLHINNGRYLTLMDVGRMDHFVRTGLMAQTLRNRWKPLLGSATVRFRRELRTFEVFDLVTRLSCWDRKWLYMEQRFERGGELHAWGAVRAVVKDGRRTVPPAELLRLIGVEQASPLPGEELEAWIGAQEPDRPVQLAQ